MPVVSVDLAYKNPRDIGVAVLEARAGRVRCTFHRVPLPGPLQADALADHLDAFCTERGANVLLVDGPQAWKGPGNGLVHARRCERALNTPAKTGLPGAVKPANYAPFVRFSVDVFGALLGRGWTLYTGLPNGLDRTLFESFPLSAWRSLGVRALPAKSRTKPGDVGHRLKLLAEVVPLECEGDPT